MNREREKEPKDIPHMADAATGRLFLPKASLVFSQTSSSNNQAITGAHVPVSLSWDPALPGRAVGERKIEIICSFGVRAGA